jgi:hypothetical protein
MQSGDRAEQTARGEFRFRWAHSLGQVFRCLLGEVKCEFAI